MVSSITCHQCASGLGRVHGQQELICNKKCQKLDQVNFSDLGATAQKISELVASSEKADSFVNVFLNEDGAPVKAQLASRKMIQSLPPSVMPQLKKCIEETPNDQILIAFHSKGASAVYYRV